MALNVPETSWSFAEWEKALGALPDVTDMDDVKRGTDELKLSSRLVKTEEEIERFTVDERLGDIERATFLTNSDTLTQKLSVLTNINNLLCEREIEVQNVLLPLILTIVQNDTIEYQIAAGQMLMSLFSAPLHSLSSTPHPDSTQHICKPSFLLHVSPLVLPVARKLLESRSQEVVEVWAELLITTIKYLPMETIENDILPEALIDGGLAQPVPFRIWCCRVLGAVALRLDGKKIERLFFKRAMTLCQDTDYEVRRCMCLQLPALARSLGPLPSRHELLEEFRELLMDDEDTVREATLSNFVLMIQRTDAEARLKILIPLYRRICEERAEKLMPLLAKETGPFLWETRGQLTESDSAFFLGFYQGLGVAQSVDLRDSCAYNFPVYGADKYESFQLDKLYSTLASDMFPEVRRKIAASFHEVATLLAKDAGRLLRPVFLRLISDPVPDIAQTLYPHIDRILTRLSSNEPGQRDLSAVHQMDDLLFAILRRERDSAANIANWRSHHELLKQFANFPDYFDSDQLVMHCLPVLVKMLSETVFEIYKNVTVPIKKTIVRTLVIYLRRLRRLDQRDRVCKTLQEFASQPSCHNRMLFLDVCAEVLDIFSSKYFRENFVTEYIELAKDPVVNIRLRFCKMIPAVRRTMKPPADPTLITRITDIVTALSTTDTQHDVAVAALEATNELKALTANDQGGEGTTGGFLTGGVDKEIATELADRAKEEEEERTLLEEWESDEAAKRREIEEARVEFGKRLAAEKEARMKGKGGRVGPTELARRASAVANVGLPAVSKSPDSAALRRKASFGSGSGSGSGMVPPFAAAAAGGTPAVNPRNQPPPLPTSIPSKSPLPSIRNSTLPVGMTAFPSTSPIQATLVAVPTSNTISKPAPKLATRGRSASGAPPPTPQLGSLQLASRKSNRSGDEPLAAVAEGFSKASVTGTFTSRPVNRISALKR
ncbi:Serine/threonine-protein phosphatase 4 regulatory subunit 4 [Gonapodya sp. JEL0774]|nr:Serine/threonine-protein phosphatase 4 regulatory subunit 4 [Gonapodya sp. JEL0774]